MTTTGFVKVLQTEVVNGKNATFNKVLVVVSMPYFTKDGEHKERNIPIEYFGEAANEVIGNIKVGDFVEAGFYLSGREWQGRWFPSINGTTIQKGESRSEKDVIFKDMGFTPEKPQPQQAPQPQQQADPFANAQKSDDEYVPF